MKTIQVEDITKNIREMCIEANHFLTEDMKAAMEQACNCLLYTSPSPRDT